MKPPRIFLEKLWLRWLAIGLLGCVGTVLMLGVVADLWLLASFLFFVVAAPYFVLAPVLPERYRFGAPLAFERRYLLALATLLVALNVQLVRYGLHDRETFVPAEECWISILCITLLSLITHNEIFSVPCRYRACELNRRALWREWRGKDSPLSQVHEACVAESRAPTPEEHARVLAYLFEAIDEAQGSVDADALRIAGERDKAFAERISLLARATEGAIAHIESSIVLADRHALNKAINDRITCMSATVKGVSP